MTLFEALFYMVWRGIAIGIIISAPMGPVGILCVQRTLDKGRLTGFFTGVGATVSDLIYCLITGFGLSFIEDFLTRNQNPIQLAGSFVLIFFGIYLFRSNPARQIRTPSELRVSPHKNMLSGFLFTFSNPLIIFLIIGLFARFNFLGPGLTWPFYVVGYLSIVGGALLWWYVVTLGISKLRSHFNLRSMWLINKITGGIIMIFALVGLITATVNMAGAARYYNAARGYLLPGVAPGAEPILRADGPDTVYCAIPLQEGRGLQLSFRCASLRNHPSKSYKYTGHDGKPRKVRFTSWGIMLLYAGQNGLDTLRYELTGATAEDMPRLLRAECRLNGQLLGSNAMSRDVDLYQGVNSFRVEQSGQTVTLYAGNRRYKEVLSVPAQNGELAGAAIYAVPGAEIRLSDIAVHREPMPLMAPEDADFAADDICGLWGLTDYNVDSDRILAGGNYILRVVRADSLYMFIYENGAEKHGHLWHKGMVKGWFAEAGDGVSYDVTWLDSKHHPISDKGRLQVSVDSLMTVRFPVSNASLIFRKTE